MLTTPVQDSMPLANDTTATPTGAVTLTPDVLRQRLAEAAAYAVLQRMAPVLRHDLVGTLQPVGILMTLLQRRIQMPDPDLQAIAKNLASVSAIAKEGTTGCINAMGWITSKENPLVNLRTSVDEAAQLMAMELSEAGLKISNDISDNNTVVPQSFFRSVLIGALLAFCDQTTTGGSLKVTLEAGSKDTDQPTQLMLCILPGGTDKAPKIITNNNIEPRSIDWADIQALAGLFDVNMARGDQWLTLDMSACNQ
jgi:hypothetical protein